MQKVARTQYHQSNSKPSMHGAFLPVGKATPKFGVRCALECSQPNSGVDRCWQVRGTERRGIGSWGGKGRISILHKPNPKPTNGPFRRKCRQSYARSLGERPEINVEPAELAVPLLDLVTEVCILRESRLCRRQANHAGSRTSNRQL